MKRKDLSAWSNIFVALCLFAFQPEKIA